jgi:hypothetical protein
MSNEKLLDYERRVEGMWVDSVVVCVKVLELAGRRVEGMWVDNVVVCVKVLELAGRKEYNCEIGVQGL